MIFTFFLYSIETYKFIIKSKWQYLYYLIVSNLFQFFIFQIDLVYIQAYLATDGMLRTLWLIFIATSKYVPPPSQIVSYFIICTFLR